MNVAHCVEKDPFSVLNGAAVVLVYFGIEEDSS